MEVTIEITLELKFRSFCGEVRKILPNEERRVGDMGGESGGQNVRHGETTAEGHVVRMESRMEISIVGGQETMEGSRKEHTVKSRRARAAVSSVEMGGGGREMEKGCAITVRSGKSGKDARWVRSCARWGAFMTETLIEVSSKNGVVRGGKGEDTVNQGRC